MQGYFRSRRLEHANYYMVITTIIAMLFAYYFPWIQSSPASHTIRQPSFPPDLMDLVPDR